MITTNGIHKLNANTGSSITTILVSGDLGGGVAELGYTNSSAEFIPLVDGALVIGGQYEVRHGGGVHIFLRLTGSTNAALDVLTGPIG